MEYLVKIWGWLAENYGMIFGLIFGLIAVAKTAASFTKSKKDDEAVSRFEKFMKTISGLFGKKEEKKDDGKSNPDNK